MCRLPVTFGGGSRMREGLGAGPGVGAGAEGVRGLPGGADRRLGGRGVEGLFHRHVGGAPRRAPFLAPAGGEEKGRGVWTGGRNPLVSAADKQGDGMTSVDRKFGTSQSVPRKEDVRFLTGQGRYMEDALPEGAAARGLRAQPGGARRGRAGSRSPRRAAMPGVLAVFTAADLAGKLGNCGRLRDGEEPRRQLRRRPAAADPGRGPGALRRRGDGAGGRRDPGGGARRRRGGRRRLRRAAGARRDRRGRAGDPSRGAGQPRLRLGVRRRGRGRRGPSPRRRTRRGSSSSTTGRWRCRWSRAAATADLGRTGGCTSPSPGRGSGGCATSSPTSSGCRRRRCG